MAGIIDGSSRIGAGGQGRRRARQLVRRTRRVEFTLTGEEYAIVVAAARRAGLARGAYAAQAALTAAANRRPLGRQEPLGLALLALGRAATPGEADMMAAALWAARGTVTRFAA